MGEPFEDQAAGDTNFDFGACTGAHPSMSARPLLDVIQQNECQREREREGGGETEAQREDVYKFNELQAADVVDAAPALLQASYTSAWLLQCDTRCMLGSTAPMPFFSIFLKLCASRSHS